MLPKIDVVTYELEVPSIKQKITYRPFLVKEQKILLMALYGGDEDEIYNAIRQIINNCIVTPGFDVEKLTMFDLEYILLHLRMKSMTDKMTLHFKPIENSECEECRRPRSVDVDLNKTAIEFNPNHSKKIELTSAIGLIMKYPSPKVVASVEKVLRNTDDIQAYFSLIWSCIESVYDESGLHSPSDYSKEEGVEFLESLRPDHFAKIETFFNTMPKLKQTVKIKCKSCSFEEDFVLEGLPAFFD